MEEGGLHFEVSVHAGRALRKSNSHCAITGFCAHVTIGAVVGQLFSPAQFRKREAKDQPNVVFSKCLNSRLCNLRDVPACCEVLISYINTN